MSNVLGIISEYNPFHNGHLYHLTESKEVNHLLSVNGQEQKWLLKMELT